MSYAVPLETTIFPQELLSFKDFIKSLNIKNDNLIFLSQGCYNWLKQNSLCITNSETKVFREHNTQTNAKAYIETINIDSSDCSFLKNILSKDYNYEYTNGIPKKVIVLLLENEYVISNEDISACVIESNNSENPVDCIIETPDLFEDSIVLLSAAGYKRLKANTNTISNVYSLERLVWEPDYKYPGGNIILHRVTPNSLYIMYSMNFPFFRKSFTFKQLPKHIYFIS